MSLSSIMNIDKLIQLLQESLKEYDKLKEAILSWDELTPEARRFFVVKTELMKKETELLILEGEIAIDLLQLKRPRTSSLHRD